jgi:hypothetical protein
MKQEQIQQGDVLIERVDSIPPKSKTLPHRTLREGEATGHSHVAVAEDVRLFMQGGKLFMSAPSGTTIVHEEHNPVTVPPGDYAINGVREYDHFDEESREVLD